MLFPRTLGALCLLVIFLTGCTSSRVNRIEADAPVTTVSSFDHSLFNFIVQTYVREDGMVDYAALKESGDLEPYLRQLAGSDPSGLSEPERLAFYLNAYNALAIKLILDNYPTASILRLSPVGIKGLPFLVPKVNTPFKVDIGVIGGEVVSLDEVEHGIIREEFSEPRIHFALVCAAVGCPPLRQEAYRGAVLDAQLEEQATVFLSDSEKNRFPEEGDTIYLSKIFKWFSEDFGDTDDAVQAYVAPYAPVSVRAGLLEGTYKINYTDYDWSLNDISESEDAPGADQ